MKNLILCIAIAISAPAFAQTQFFQDNFENAATPDVAAGSTRVPENNSGTGGPPNTGYFKRSTNLLTDIQLAFGTPYGNMSGSFIWAGEDHDTPFGVGNEEQQIEWTNINISGRSGLEFRGNLGANNTNGPWDNGTATGGSDPQGPTGVNDYIIIDYAIDAGPYIQLAIFVGDGTLPGPPNKTLKEDTNGDGVGDGMQLTSTLSQLTKTIPGTGTTMKLRIRAKCNGTNEEWAIDNFRLYEAGCPTISTQPSNASVCAGSNTSFTVVTAGATSWQWQENSGSGFANITNGGVYSGATTQTLVLTAPGVAMNTYTYRCIATVGACNVTSNAVTLTVNALPSASITGTNTICSGQSTTLTASGGGSYLWSTGATTAAITVSPVSLTVYTCTVTNVAGCTASASRTVTVNALPSASSTSTTICAGQSATITASGGGTYLWSTGATTAALTQSPGGTTVYTVTVTSVAGCTATANGTITVNPLPPASITGTNTICNGQSTTLTCTGGGSYLWNTGATTTAVTVSPIGTTVYTCTVTSVAGCTAVASSTVTVNSLPSASSTNATICAGQSATITASGGGTYLWNTGATTAALTQSPGGTTVYTVTVTSAAGCTATANGTITVNPLPTPSVTGTNTVCLGQSTTLTCTGGGSYLWSTGAATAAVTVSPTVLTVYTCTVTNVAGCTASASRAVTVTTPSPASIIGATTICSGGSTTLTAVGGSTYLWSTGATTAGITIAPPVTTVYTVTVTGVGGCTTTVSRTVTVSNPTFTSASQNNVSCFGGSNGAASVTPASGGIAPYTYDWTLTPTGDGTTAVSGLNAGTWICTVTDASSCTASVSFNITQPSSAVAGSTVVTNVACFGGTTGAIDLTPSGGTPGYTYNWGSSITTQDRTGLPAGTYAVIITDASGCSNIVNVTVTQPTSPVSGSTVVTNVACFGGTTGAIDLTPSGGTPGYTYNWGSSITTQDRTGLAAGTYSVIITDASGCTATINATVTQPPTAVSGSTVVTNVTCFGGTTGAIDLTPTGGTPGYTYNWGSSITTQDRTGLAAGTYSVIITDASGCTATINATVTQPPTAVSGSTVVTNVTCFGGTTGAIDLTPSGGTPGYTYNWGSSITTQDRTGLAAGTYSVIITDASGCTATINATVTQPPTAVSGSTVVTNVVCFGGTTGAIDLTPTGGTPGYTYNWGSSITTQDRTGLAAGTYSVIITDASGCTATINATVTQPPTAVSGSTVVTNVTCFGGTTGAIDLTPSGGTPGYTYNWGSSITTQDRTGLAAGTYNVVITDANGCTAATTVTVTQPTLLVAGSSATSITCNGGTSTVTVTASGGTAPYTGTGTFLTTAGTQVYTITDANGCSATTTVVITQPTTLAATSSAPPVLCNGGTTLITVAGSGGTAPYTGTGTFTMPAGTHSYTVTDANGCTATTTIVITQPAALVATSSATSILCNGGTAVVTVAGSGGTSPYTGTGTFTVSAGTHSYTVTDANGCIATTTIVITQPTALTVSQSATPILCNGGTSVITVTGSGGTPPYTGEGTFTVTAGTYSYMITDANGCTATTSLVITEPTPITVMASATSILCNGGTATVTVVPIGGTPPYTGGGIFTVTAGVYTYTITDANGCTTTTSIVVTEPPALTVTSSATSILCNGGSATVTVAASGGTSPYTGEGTFTVTAGPYSYTVTDANGCTAVASGTITEPTAMATTVSSVNVLCNGDSTGSIDVTVTGGTLPYTFDWNSGTYTSEDLTGIGAGTYVGTITDANGCTDGGTIVITEPLALVALVTTTTNPTVCGATDGAIDITVSGGVTAYTFLWNTTATSEDISGIGAGAYTCTVTDANGCTTSVGGNLNDPNAPAVTLTIAMDTLCVDDGMFTLSGESPAGGTFSGPGVSGGMFDPMTAGIGMHTISYTYTDISGCTGSTTDSIYVDICLGTQLPVAYSLFSVYPNPNSGTFTLHLNTNTAAHVLIYDAQGKLISNHKVQNSNQQVTIAEPGMYMITVITADGQQSSQRVIVTE